MLIISYSTSHPAHKTEEQHPTPEDKLCCPHYKRLEALVDHYAHPGVAPPSARMHPGTQTNAPPIWKSWHSWKYAWFVAAKATQMTGDALMHSVWGPRKKSWNIQMTLMSALFRDAGKHTELMDVPSIRLFMGMSSAAPSNADALVTPVTFTVRRRRLRGILAALDGVEDGTRELSGEWIVGKHTWQRLQSEWKAAQSGEETASRAPERVILYIHGGAYYVGSAEEKRVISVPLAQYTDSRVFSLNYRLAPETHFPGPLHDAVSAYFRLVDDLHIQPANIIISGDSAGGALSLALMLYLRDNQYPLPGGAILMSPWVDMTMSCPSWDFNAEYDVIPVFQSSDHMNPISCYLGEGMSQYLTHPYASPIFGDFTGLPPILIHSGDSEVLVDEIALIAHRMELNGVKVRHEQYRDGVHVFQTFPFLKIWPLSFESMRAFVQETLPEASEAFTDKAERNMENEIDTESAVAVSSDGRVAANGKDALEDAHPVASQADGAPEDQDGCDTCGHGQTWSIGHHEDEEHVRISVKAPESAVAAPMSVAEAPLPATTISIPRPRSESTATSWDELKRAADALRTDEDVCYGLADSEMEARKMEEIEEQIDTAWHMWAM